MRDRRPGSSDYVYVPVPAEAEPIWNQDIGRLPARYSPRLDRSCGTPPVKHKRVPPVPEFDGDPVQTDPERLQEEIDKISQQEEDQRKRLNELSAIWGQRRMEIEGEIAKLRKNREDIMQEQLLLLAPPDPGPDFAGPDILRWVESEAFHSLATLVILANLTIMVLEMVNPEEYEARWGYLDHFFMTFYLIELTLKAILWQGKLLCGKLEVAWWNYLDIIIVVSGVVDMWLRPLLVMMHIMPEQRKGPSILSFLRMLRLSRVLKIIGVFLHADLSWAEGPIFQLFIIGDIGFNSILMGLEADIPHYFLWFYVEQLLLAIFSFELLVRIRHSGCEFFFSTGDLIWNWLDLIIVFGGIVDQWLMPMISVVKHLLGEKSTGESGSMGQVMMILRMARLLRILRLVRLVKSIPPLYTLIVGIVQAMQGMGWVLVLTTVLLYAFALLGVKLVGHGLLFGDAPVDQEVLDVFPTVFQSMFVLFKSMNGDWEALEPLFARLPATKLMFIMFTVISTWAILSILTAVVSDNMLNAANKHRDEELQAEQAEKTEQSIKMLEDIFNSIDQNGSGTISKAEFDQLLHGSNDPTEADALKIAANLSERDLEEMFDILSHVPPEGGDPVITREAFIENLQIESKPVCMRAMMKLEKRICDVEHLLRSIASSIEQINRSSVGCRCCSKIAKTAASPMICP